jgi:KDO2-lipid IV(A) lauroyltransferase
MYDMMDREGKSPSPPRLGDYFAYAGFVAVRGFFRRLPLPVAASISAFAWRHLAPRTFRHRRAMANLKAAMPELSDEKRARLLDRMWDNLGRTSVEAFRLNEIADNAAALTFNVSAEVVELVKSGKPAIFTSLHLGNWEVTALAAEYFNTPLIGVYKKVLNPLVDRAVRHMRARFYHGGLVSRGRDTVRNITRAIKDGYSVAIMGDLRDTHGDFVQFFGIPSRSTPFPALLARRHGLPIIVIRAVRTAPGIFRIDAERLALAESPDRKADIAENTLRLQAKFEDWIREDPALWMWGHRRWNPDSFEQ